MGQKIYNAIIKLRRDNDYNSNLVANTFIPANGEVCVVDDAHFGVRAKVGDGVHTYGALAFTDTYTLDRIVERGYLIAGEFYYTDSATAANKIDSVNYKLYLDIPSGRVYYYNTSEYALIKSALPTATASEAGVMKLDTAKGTNTDGTMTQKAITDAIDALKIKVEEDSQSLNDFTIEFKGFNFE